MLMLKYLRGYFSSAIKKKKNGIGYMSIMVVLNKIGGLRGGKSIAGQ